MHKTIEQFLARGPRLPKSVPPGRIVPQGTMGVAMPDRVVALPGGRGAHQPGGHAPKGLAAPKAFDAARVSGFRYPNKFRETSPRGMWNERNAKPSRCTTG